MSGAHHNTPAANEPAPGYRAIRWNIDWITRPLFGLALAGIAIWLLFSAPIFFSILIVVITIPAAFEWYRIVGGGKLIWLEIGITLATVIVSITALTLTHQIWLPLLFVAIGAIAVALLASHRGQHPLWQLLGVVYLGLPALALIGLRNFPSSNRGQLTIAGLLLIVWATDTGALIFGNLIGGPRMAPKLSPSKTWAGTIGGSITAAGVFGLYILVLNGSLGLAFLFALAFSATAHAGDLFESFVKRRFGIKNSGSLIPGHGGVLDRMDSTLAASVALAVLVFLLHLDPLFGGAS